MDESLVMYLLQSQRHLEQNLPDTKVIESGLETGLCQEAIQATLFAELCLNVQMAIVLPAVHKGNNMVAVGQGLENLDFANTALAIL